MKHFCLIFLRNLLSIYFYRWQNFSTGLSWLWQIRTCWIWWVGAKKVFRNLYHATEKTGGGPIALANTASSLSLELSHLDGMIQCLMDMSHYFGASLHERESLVLQAPLKSLERKWCSELSFFNLLFQCRRARFESKFISRMRFYHLDFVLLIFIE